MNYNIQRLDNHKRADILNLLSQDLYSNLFLIDILLRRGISNWGNEEWFGAYENGVLHALVVAFGRSRLRSKARLLVAVGHDDACIELGSLQHSRGGCELMIGERKTTDALFVAFTSDPVHNFYDQRLYICTEYTSGDSVPIHVASPKDYNTILEASAQMMREDLLIDPMQEYPDRFRQQVQSKIEQHKCLVAKQENHISFLIDIGTQFRLGAQVGGTYVPPAFRGAGMATKAMRSLCQLLLKSCNCVTLHVHEKNIPAIKCYEKVGFVSGAPFRLISFKGSS